MATKIKRCLFALIGRNGNENIAGIPRTVYGYLWRGALHDRFSDWIRMVAHTRRRCNRNMARWNWILTSNCSYMWRMPVPFFDVNRDSHGLGCPRKSICVDIHETGSGTGTYQWTFRLFTVNCDQVKMRLTGHKMPLPMPASLTV